MVRSLALESRQSWVGIYAAIITEDMALDKVLISRH